MSVTRRSGHLKRVLCPLLFVVFWALLLGAALSFLSQFIQSDRLVMAIQRSMGHDAPMREFSFDTYWFSRSSMIARSSRLGRSTACYVLPNEPDGPVRVERQAGSDVGSDLDSAMVARKVAHDWWKGRGRNLDAVVVYIVGYPIASWYGAWIHEPGAPRGREYGGFDAAALLGPPAPGDSYLVCFFPLWPWVVFNWLFWSAFAWCGLMLVSFARVRRAARRRRRGDCVRCRYHVGDLPVCPECGTPSGAANAASGVATGTQTATAALSAASGPPNAAP
jgi:hypothetical protein